MTSPLSRRTTLRTRAAVLGLLVFGCVFLTQCGDDEVTGPSGPTIDENISALSHLEQAAPFSERPVGTGDVNTYERDGRVYECTEQEYEVAAEFDEQLTLNPTSDVLWPGALIDGATIPTGAYTPIVADRAPLTISISLVNLAGEKSRTVENPALSTIRTAIGEILAQEVTGATDARVTFEIEDIHSESQLDIALGVTYRSGLNSVKNQFNFSNEEALSRTLVKFLQVYYTIDVDVPQKASDLFDASVKWSDLDPQIQGTISPLYVSSIAYGRMALFSMESKYSSTQVKNALQATYESVKDGGTGELDLAYRTVLQETTIKATIIGGSGASAVQVVNGFEGLRQYMTQGGNYDKNTAAAPLAYKLRYLCDNGTCQLVMAQNYVVRACDELLEGHYAVRTIATVYSARLIVDYKLDGESKHVESPLLEWPFGHLTAEFTIDRYATDVVVQAKAIWFATTPTIFRYPVSGSLRRPDVKCWKLMGMDPTRGAGVSYEVIDCEF